jgi:hypothetical protein
MFSHCVSRRALAESEGGADMWAEVTIRTKGDLPSDLQARLIGYFHDGVANTQNALEKTALDPELLPQILLARRSAGAMTLLLSPDLQKVKAYIDNSIGSKTLDPLKREIKVLREDLKRFLASCNTSIQELTVQIGAEGDTLLVGEYQGFWARLGEAFKDHAMAKLYVPIATYLASLATGVDQQRALQNVAVALVALAIWVLLEALVLRDPLAYKG